MTIDYLAHLRSDTARFAEIAAAGPLEAEIGGCPGWDLAGLVTHLGIVHRWAAACARTGEKQRFPEPPAVTGDELVEWYRASAAEVIDALESLDPASATWHLFPVEQVGAVWHRRQAQESAVHRWDAEHAVGQTTPIDPELASDGIDEYWGVMLPRKMQRMTDGLPEASIHLHCTDVAGEWTVRVTDGALQVQREHAKGDAALRGRAEDLLLALWGRPGAVDRLDIVGDPAAASAWLAIGGN